MVVMTSEEGSRHVFLDTVTRRPVTTSCFERGEELSYMTVVELTITCLFCFLSFLFLASFVVSSVLFAYFARSTVYPGVIVGSGTPRLDVRWLVSTSTQTRYHDDTTLHRAYQTSQNTTHPHSDYSTASPSPSRAASPAPLRLLVPTEPLNPTG
jgi:hypothetical protein